MSELSTLLGEIRRQLKAQKRTYRDVAQHLGLSEPSVKRMFASGQLPADRLIRLCEMLGFTLTELSQLAASQAEPLRSLELAQEQKLVANPQLLLVAVCALNGWAMPEILARYEMTELACLQHLLALDRMGVIRLLPGNRIRATVARDFNWIADGPIQNFFRQTCLDDYLASGQAVDGANDGLLFLHAMLSPAALTELRQEISRLRKKFAELHRESLGLPLEHKTGVGLLLALRDWEPLPFRELRRQTD